MSEQSTQQEPRYDADGPVVLWIDYGLEGWAPRSFDTTEAALVCVQAHGVYGTWTLTRVIRLASTPEQEPSDG